MNNMRSLRIAFGLMTTLPFRLPDDWSAGDSGRASVWYPLVGLVIGALTWLVWKGAMSVFPSLVAGIITLVVWVALTGGLHLDGLADCCDGLFASVSVERRLEIMKDPHLGAFGAIGLILVLLLKAATLATLTPATSFGILLAASFARAGASCLPVCFHLRVLVAWAQTLLLVFIVHSSTSARYCRLALR